MTAPSAVPTSLRRHPLGMVIFDCDGVLIDSEAICNRVVAEVLTADGWAMTADECEARFIGLTFHDTQVMAEAHLKRCLGADWVDRLVVLVVEAMARDVLPMDGALEALAAVDAMGLPWRIASNSSHEEMDAKFGRVGWQDLVRGRTHSAADCIARGGAGKPAPDVFLDAAMAQGIDPAACLVIEDSLPGAIAARSAGMACLGLAPHGDGSALAGAGARVFRSMRELPNIVREAMA